LQANYETNRARVKKISISYSFRRKTKIAFSIWSYGRQLLKYVCIAGKAKGSTNQVLLQLLKMRLNNILFQLGMASTIPQARQFINHIHVLYL